MVRLAGQGVTYEPQFLSTGELSAIATAPQERCGRSG